MNTKTKRGEEKNNYFIIEKISYLEKFFELSDKMKAKYLEYYDIESIHKILKYSTLDQIDFNDQFSTEQLLVILESHKLLYQIHSGLLQQIVLDNHDGSNKPPHYESLLFKRIYLEYRTRFFTQQDVFISIFDFFWQLANPYQNISILERSAVEINSINQNKEPHETKVVYPKIVEKILLGNFISPLEIHEIEKFYDDFKILLRIRQIIPINIDNLEIDFKKQEFVRI